MFFQQQQLLRPLDPQQKLAATLTSSRGPSSPHPIKFGLNYTEALQLTSNIMYGPWSMPPEGFNTFVVLL